MATKDIDNLGSGETLKIGNKLAGNYVEFDEDGSPRLKGDATVYEDIIGDVMSRNLTSTRDRIDYDFAENMIIFQNNGDITDKDDRLQFNVQIPHQAVVGSAAYMLWHIHWFQEDTVQRELTFKYRLQNNGSAKTTAWSTIQLKTHDTEDLFTYSSGTLNQITTFKSEIDITGADISSTLQVQVCREDSNSGNLNVTFLDAHIAIDSDGSKEEWSKD